MYSTTAYLYQQKTRVLLIDTSGAYFTMRYDPVYAKPLTINKGVDNVILFEFINQDEKPVNITGSTLIFRAVSQNGAELLLEKEMVILNAPFGRAKVTLTTGDLDPVISQPASYSISRASGNLTEAVFTDAQAGARAPVNIVDSVYPEFVPSFELSIPDTNLPAQAGSAGSSSATYPDWALNPGSPILSTNPMQNTEYYSSFIEPTGPVTTIQMDLIGYTGTIKAQAAQNYQSIFYNVTDSTTYLNKTGTVHLNVIGWHPLLRLAFNNSIWTTAINNTTGFGQPAQATAQVTDGVITGVSITNNGFGYLAPPLIEFAGDGAGARAVATLGGNGSVTSITVIDGGSGYRPIPPTMIGASVLISTGRAENLLYR
jgi:hypothetical protein